MNANDQPLSTHVIYATFDYWARYWGRILLGGACVCLLIVLMNGFYIINKEEEGVLTRFGKVVRTEIQPGIGYRMPLAEEIHIRKVLRIVHTEISSRKGDMVHFSILSGDMNLLEIDLAIQYKISDLKKFLFEATEPELLAKMLVRESLVDAIGQNFIDLIFTSNRSIIESQLFEVLRALIADQEIGIELITLNILDVRPIDETRMAFRDVNNAIAEKEQASSEAHRQKEKFLARSRGQAESILQTAKARAKERLVQATSSASAFHALLDEYNKQPKQVAITRYWQRMRTIFTTASLAAVNPGDDSTIDINMIDGTGTMPIDMALDVPPGVAIAGDDEHLIPAATAVRDTHAGRRLEMDQYTMSGRFHTQAAERDHMPAASPRSLIFDAPSIFAHRHVSRSGPNFERQPEQQPLVESIPAEEKSQEGATSTKDGE